MGRNIMIETTTIYDKFSPEARKKLSAYGKKYYDLIAQKENEKNSQKRQELEKEIQDIKRKWDDADKQARKEYYSNMAKKRKFINKL